jgi:hypothetical protein
VAPAAAHHLGQRGAGRRAALRDLAQGNETWAARAADFCCARELLQAFGALRVVAYEDGFLDAPARFVQRIAAVREPLAPSGPLRLPLVGTP